MKSHRLYWFLLFAIAALALALRLPDLGKRPMHTDETINAYITGQILDGEGYRYDPRDRHGPALYASTAAISWLCGVHSLAEMDESTFRLTPAILSGLAVLVFAGFRRPLGAAASSIAALLWAVAPMPLFYGRYVIHETGFIAATVIFMAAICREWTTPTLARSIVTGAMAAVMLSFKETAILTFAAMGIALVLVVPFRMLLAPVRFWIAGAVAFLVLTVIFFTWGFSDWNGLVNIFNAFIRFSGRAGGEGHAKSFWYYGHLLADGWGGKLFLGSAIFGAVRAWRAGRFHRLVVLLAAASFLIYSAIPYKTPWLALNIWMPLALLAAFGIMPRHWRTVTHHKLTPMNATVSTILLAAFGVAMFVALGRDTWKRVYFRPADDVNPYAYAHTQEDMLRLEPFIDGFSKKFPAGRNLKIAVVADDAWPVPWYLRRVKNVGYWQSAQDPGPADVYLTDMTSADKIARYIEGWRPEFFGVRPNVLFILWYPDPAKQKTETPQPKAP